MNEQPSAATGDQADQAQSQTGQAQDQRQIRDAQTMRALAHPVRLALLEALRRDGELTATRAAELLDESPGNMSWHLQTLAKYGFIEEAPGGKGRSRPWRIVNESTRISPPSGDAAANAAADTLVTHVLERNLQENREWVAYRSSCPDEWQRSAFLTDSLTYLTPAELSEISDQISDICHRYADRSDKSKRPEGALPVRLTAGGHPLPQTPTGN